MEALNLDDRFSHLVKLALKPELISLQRNLLKEIQQVVKNELKLAIQELKAETQKNSQRRESNDGDEVFFSNCAEVDMTPEISRQSIITVDGTEERAVDQKEKRTANKKIIEMLPETEVRCNVQVREEDAEMPGVSSGKGIEVPSKSLVTTGEIIQDGYKYGPVVTFVPPAVPIIRHSIETEASGCGIQGSEPASLVGSRGENDPGPSGQEPFLLKRQRIEVPLGTSRCDGPGSQIEAQAISANSSSSAKQEVISNYVVVKTIFSMLDAPDVRSCSKVNKLWHEIAERMYTWIDIDCRPCHLDRCKYVGKVVNNSGKISNWHGLSWNGATEEVEKHAGKKIFMTLSIGGVKLDVSDFHYFLSQCGNYVSQLELSTRMLDLISTSNFLTFIASNFPNLVKLTLDGNFNFSDSELESAEIRLEKLQTIDFGITSKFSGNFVSAVMNFAVNCSKVKNYPIEFVEYLRFRGSIHIRSVSFPPMYNMKPETAEILLNKLSSFEPELSQFNWLFITCSKFMKVQSIRESLNKIFESSKNTMKWAIVARPTGPSEYLNFPIMSRLKSITFEDDERKRKNSVSSSFFQLGVDPAIIFPNVKTIVIRTRFTTRQQVNESFPKEIFETFGSRIETLETWAKRGERAKPECLEELGILFPNITRLDIEWSSEMSDVLEQVYKSWKYLKVLKLLVRDFSIFSKWDRRHCFDVAVTGLNVTTLADLKNGKIAMEEVPGSLYKLTQLQKLYITILDKKLKVCTGSDNFITTVTTDYVKCHMPKLRIFLGILPNTVHLKKLLDLIAPVLPLLECDDGYGSFENWNYQP